MLVRRLPKQLLRMQVGLLGVLLGLPREFRSRLVILFAVMHSGRTVCVGRRVV